MAANILWSLGGALLYLAMLIFWPVALLLSPLLAFPTVGIFRICALIVRGEGVSFWDGTRAWRELFWPTLVAGIGVVLSLLVFLANLFGGLQSGDLLGIGFATLAGWGLVFGWLWTLCFWPLLTDPRREGWGFRGAARGAAYLVVAHPVRLGVFGVLLFVLFLVSTVAFAALITISVSYGALVACHYVLPAADRLEARMAAAGVLLGPTAVRPGPAADPLGDLSLPA